MMGTQPGAIGLCVEGPTARKESPMEMAIAHLSASIEGLRDMTERLDNKLQPIITPVPKTAEQKTDFNSGGELTNLIHRKAMEVDEIINRLRDMRDSIDL